MANLDNVNILKLHRYLTSSEIVPKLEIFIESHPGSLTFLLFPVAIEVFDRINLFCSFAIVAIISDTSELPHRPLANVTRFLSCLRHVDDDGRVMSIKDNMKNKFGHDEIHHSASTNDVIDGSKDAFLKYICLSAAGHFQRIVDSAACVALVGGTMQPFSYIESSLLRRVDRGRVKFFSCSHVVNRSNVLTHVLSIGPDGTDFDFRFSSRLVEEVVRSLRMTIR